MPLAMATILNVNIIIFIKNSHSPMYVTSLTDYSEKTIFLIYDPEGPGHYDAALPYSYMNDQQSNEASIKSENIKAPVVVVLIKKFNIIMCT